MNLIEHNTVTQLITNQSDGLPERCPIKIIINILRTGKQEEITYLHHNN